MGVLYVLTLIVLGISFMAFKKSDKKLNFIKWLIIYFVSLFGYNIAIGMILGMLNIVSYIWLLSLINLLVAFALGFKTYKYKNFQKYEVRKIDVFCLCVILIIFMVMFFKDLYIFSGDISHNAVDSAIHYRAAKHYSKNLIIFINAEDKTFFDFNVMQTGAYINYGIFMNIMNRTFKIDYPYLYQIAETLVLYLSGLAFYSSFMEKIKTKRGAIFSLMLFGLYIYGYPYNSWFYGFSYHSVGIMMVAILLTIVEMLYSEENINKRLIISLITLNAIGLIFSYCLFVPAIFAAICIYCFLKDLKLDGKRYLKFFKENTLVVTGILLFITAAGIAYLFIPTFFISGQTDLISALKIDGGIYSEKYKNIIPYIPFAIFYFVDIIIKIKNKKLNYFDIFAVVTVGFFAVILLGNRFGKISKYYMFKVYSILWIVIFGVTIDVINDYIDLKAFKYIGPAYVTIWCLFVCSWVWIKAGHVIGEEEKHALPNYVGIYYDENCNLRKLVDLTSSFSKEELEVVNFARENIPDLTADNLELTVTHNFHRIWATAVLEINGTMPYNKFIQDMTPYNLKNALNDKEKKYFMQLANKEQGQIDALNIVKTELKESNEAEILFENEYGVIAKINREEGK